MCSRGLGLGFVLGPPLLVRPRLIPDLLKAGILSQRIDDVPHEVPKDND